MNKKIIFMIVLFGGLASGAIWLYFNLVGFKINSAPKTEPEIASCGYTNAQATSDYTFDINSIPVVNLQIDVAKDAIVEEYIEGL
ncbi:MAG: hypothetical protein LBQ02_01325, partial [Candidatus Nomurabacteria bacterium]|nr:hypothetical protein [Candidatus Nomurabacteria bacterium]